MYKTMYGPRPPYRAVGGGDSLGFMVRSSIDTDSRLRLPRKARPGIFAPPNAPADALRVRPIAAAAR